MVDRIKQVMEHEQLSPASFADAIDINRSSLTHIFTGRNQPSLDIARKILKAFPEIRTEWLIMGVGNMLQEVPAVTEASVDIVDSVRQTDLFSSAEVANTEPSSKTETVPIREDENLTSGDTGVLDKIPEENAVSSRARVNRVSESHIPNQNTKREKIINSQGDKKIVKIVFFYEDKSFDVYIPN